MHGVFLPHSCHISRMYIPDTTSGKYIMICFRVNFGTSLHLLQTALHCLATYSWLPYVFAPCLSKVRSGFPIAIYLACIESLSNWNTDYNINHWVVVSNFFYVHPENWGRCPILTTIFQRGWFNHQLDQYQDQVATFLYTAKKHHHWTSKSRCRWTDHGFCDGLTSAEDSISQRTYIKMMKIQPAKKWENIRSIILIRNPKITHVGNLGWPKLWSETSHLFTLKF